MIKRFFPNTLYVKVFENRFVLRHIESGQGVTAIATNPFSTKRLLVGQFFEAEDTLGRGLKQLNGGRWSLIKPSAVIHPMEKTEGGLSQVEERVLKELASGAGVDDAIVWVGHELSDHEVVEKLNGGKATV